jgi:clan AA aspartic protease (TIGR02281 family)
MAVADLASAEAALKEKGLTKQGTTFVVAEEAELTKGMVDIRKVQADMTKASRDLEKAEKKVSQVKAYIATKEFEARKLNEELAKPGISASKNNEIIAKLNIIDDDIKKITQGPLKDAQSAMIEVNDAFIKARGAYIEKTVGMAAIAEKIKAKYDALAKDADVAKALEEVAANSPQKKATLGPTSVCKANLTLVERSNKTILSESIPVKVEDDVPWVDVIINGKHRRSMVFDSGASSISVPWDLAKDLNMIPSSDTQKVRLQLADGKIVEGWRMTLKSVTVGPFTVEDVECAVLPENLIAAEPLLGGSFLSHFVYKLDLKSQKLDMTRVKATSEK